MSKTLRVPERRELPPGWVERQRDFLLDELASRSSADRRRRRLLIALVAAVVILLGASAFTTYSLTREPKHLESIGCYDGPSLTANVAVVDADGGDPVSTCLHVWRQGALGPHVPKQLEACVLSTGAIGVFPTSKGDTCDRLGLASLPASYAIEASRFAALRDAIVGRLGEPASGSSKRGPQCVEKTAAIAFVRRELESRGYADWRVEIAGGDFGPGRPCAEPSFDTGAKTVYLIPASR